MMKTRYYYYYYYLKKIGYKLASKYLEKHVIFKHKSLMRTIPIGLFKLADRSKI